MKQVWSKIITVLKWYTGVPCIILLLYVSKFSKILLFFLSVLCYPSTRIRKPGYQLGEWTIFIISLRPRFPPSVRKRVWTKVLHLASSIF